MSHLLSPLLISIITLSVSSPAHRVHPTSSTLCLYPLFFRASPEAVKFAQLLHRAAWIYGGVSASRCKLNQWGLEARG